MSRVKTLFTCFKIIKNQTRLAHSHWRAKTYLAYRGRKEIGQIKICGSSFFRYYFMAEEVILLMAELCFSVPYSNYGASAYNCKFLKFDAKSLYFLFRKLIKACRVLLFFQNPTASRNSSFYSKLFAYLYIHCLQNFLPL